MVPQHVAYISFLIRDSIGMCCTRKEYFKCCRFPKTYKKVSTRLGRTFSYISFGLYMDKNLYVGIMSSATSPAYIKII